MATVQETAEQAIREGLGDKEVFRRVLAVHPGAKTSTEAIRWYRERLGRAEGQGRRAGPAADEPATPRGPAISDLLRDGLPDYVVFRRAGAVSLASVRAYRSRLIGRGEDVPTNPEAQRYWEALYGDSRRVWRARGPGDPPPGTAAEELARQP